MEDILTNKTAELNITQITTNVKEETLKDEILEEI